MVAEQRRTIAIKASGLDGWDQVDVDGMCFEDPNRFMDARPNISEEGEYDTVGEAITLQMMKRERLRYHPEEGGDAEFVIHPEKVSKW